MPIIADIYYTETGKEYQTNSPLILIHGAGGNHLSWPPELRRVKGFRVLSIDLPGHGSSNGSAEQNISIYSSLLSRFMETLGIYKALLIGHSMGGAIALQHALDHSKNTIGIVLISSGAHLGNQNEILEYLSNPATYSRAIKLIQKKIFSPASDPELVNQSCQILRKTRASVLYCDWLACNHFDLRSELKKIKTPAWVITGSSDHLVPPSASYFLQSNLKNASFKMFRNYGHLLPMEAPQLVQEGLLQFLDNLPEYRKK